MPEVPSMPERTRTGWRYLAWTAALLIVAAASSCATFVYLLRKPAAPLVAGLPSDFDDASQVFDGRLRREFPVGSPEQRLTSTLREQGFEPAWMERDAPGNLAERRWEAFPCNMSASVRWTASREGLITSIRGRYGEAGCL